ncbi:hypothetical protein [Shewanella algae]|uniref:hypothetical protein n=1 Tax=Shewanella algae TaxID=38313 RepID=UPI0031F4892F
MGDPKYRASAEGIYHEDGYLLPPDEPLMILRGKDIGALNAIVDYVDMLEEQNPQTPTIVSHIKSATERLYSFYVYQVNNPDLQSVGCSRRSHVDSNHFLIRAKAKLDKLGVIAPDWQIGVQ